jgi:ribonuclease G
MAREAYRKILELVLQAAQIAREVGTKQNEKKISIILHPFIYAYYKEGLISKQMKWFFKYKKWINLIKDSSLGMVDYHFLDSNGDDIELNN